MWNPLLRKALENRSMARLSEYDVVYVTRTAIKGSALADYLAYQAIDDYEPMNFLMRWRLYRESRIGGIDKWVMKFYGASNALGHGIGARLSLAREGGGIEKRLGG